jgi:hypothetical protein
LDAINGHLLEGARAAAYGGLQMVRAYDLAVGQVLYRFVDVTRSTGPRVAADGPWWFEYEAFQQIKQFGQRHHYSLEYSARLHAAILYEWSEITGVVRAEVLQPLQAWKGRGRQVAGQGKDRRDQSRMTPMQSINEVYQLFIPGFGGPGSLYPTAMRFIEYLAA